jgi:hypothetical protein
MGYPSVRFVDEKLKEYGIKQVDNKPRVSSMPYLYDIAEGNVPGHSSWTKIGYTGSVVANTESDIWSKGGVYAFPSSGIQMSVKSSDNTNDKAGGTGALKVTIYYLDSAWAEKTEEVTLNGTTAVDTAETDIYRINGFRVTAAGSTGKAAGNISLLDKATGLITYGYITAGFTRARNSCYTVPAGKTLYVTQFVCGYGYSHNSTHYGRIYTRATYNDGVRTPGIFYPYTECVVSNNSLFVPLSIPTKLPEKVDIKNSVLADYAGIATITLRGWLE